MHVRNHGALNALERAPPRTRARVPLAPSWRKLRIRPQRVQEPSEHCSESVANSDVLRQRKEDHAAIERSCPIPGAHDLDDKQSRTVGQWLHLCGVDLNENGIRWPCERLNELPDLRVQPKQISDQCIAWQIFQDDKAGALPSFEELVPRLDFKSCRDAWFLEKPIKLKGDQFADFKVHLSQESVSKIRLLNLPVTKKMVSRVSQRQHSVMVLERVQHFYDVGKNHLVEVNNAAGNVTPKGTATEVHHDSDPHVSTVCGRSGAGFEQPMKLWLLWHASESRRLATCYSDTASALRDLGPCGYLIQYSGESLMLPANVPHAALSLSSHYLYGQTFHVEGHARDPTTLELELSARAKPSEAINTVLTCYEEGLQDPNPRTRAIHTDHIVRTVSLEKTALREAHTESYVSKVIEVLRKNRKFEGVCGLCKHFRLSPRSDTDCWSMHDLESEQALLRVSRLADHQ